MLRLARAGAVILPPSRVSTTTRKPWRTWSISSSPGSSTSLPSARAAAALGRMMGWLGFASRHGDRASPRMEIPLFPLNAVLFPGGVLPLRIFEQRYLDMTAACMKERPFGVCLIVAGEEAGGVVEPHPVGTLARITDWEMEQLGLLQVTTRGEQRFRIVDKAVVPTTCWRAVVEIIADNGPLPFPVERQRLLPLLRRIAGEIGPARIPEPRRYDDAGGSATASPKSCRCRTWPSRSCWNSKIRFPDSRSSRVSRPAPTARLNRDHFPAPPPPGSHALLAETGVHQLRRTGWANRRDA